MASIPDRLAALEEKVDKLRGEMLQVVDILALMYGARYNVEQDGLVSPESVQKSLLDSAVQQFVARRDAILALRKLLEDETE